MSNFLAVATVTSALRSLLNEAVGEDVPGATATAVRPDGTGEGLPSPGVNVYLYLVAPNPALRNDDLPTRAADGRLAQRPRAALDLHYLLTFYGDEATLEAQRVLGTAARTLHAQPLLSRERIQKTIDAAVASDPAHFLAHSDLAQEVELVKFTPTVLSLEELSKLWSVFFQTSYALSAAYQASVVLLEADEAPRRVLPVRVRHITAVPFQSARLDRAVSAAGPGEPVSFGDTVILGGAHLGGAVRAVRVGEAEVAAAAVGGTEIRVALTDAALRAGVQGVQVAYADGSESNALPLTLRPAVARDPGGDPEIAATDVVVDAGDATRSGTLTVRVAPTVGPRQAAGITLNGAPPSAEPVRAHTFPARVRSVDTDTLTFPFAGVEAGDYLVRVRVAGADSLLETDADGTFAAPRVTIP